MSKTSEVHEKKMDFLFEAYKLRAQLYGDLTNRMWNRFNYLLTATTALFGIFFNIWYTIKSFTGVFWFPVIGFIISSIWFILGAQDRYYFEGFRIQVQEIENEISNELKVDHLKRREFGSVKGVETNLITFRWKFGSLSRLPALVPLLFCLIWVLVLAIVLNTG